MASNTEIQIYYENETVSTPLWVSSGRLQYLKASFADIPLTVKSNLPWKKLWLGELTVSTWPQLLTVIKNQTKPSD